MEYAVIRTGGKQYRVAPGDLIRVEKVAGDPGAEIAFEEVLMASTGGSVHLGKPVLAGARVTGKVVLQGKAKKILVYKKKKRKNYRRHRGHRQLFTDVQVIGIEMGA
ncbi:MAG TPA: 50S ribosomal protein L21 [Candidatus Acidoferrales bacterium]|nr:50S ribosomal protein L21 [Candidatus Acidoferrales bacterium]